MMIIQKCMICDSQGRSGEIQYLSNGMFVHVDCLINLEQALSQTPQNPYQDKMSSIADQISKLRQELINENSGLKKFIGIFIENQKAIDIDNKIKSLELKQNEIWRLYMNHAEQIHQNNEPKRHLLEMIYDYYIGKPPDWDARRNIVIQTKECAKCGRIKTKRSKLEYHVHHVVPLRFGGTNKVENLIYVCSKCHSRLHHNKKLSYTYKTVHSKNIFENEKAIKARPYSIEKKIKLINEAITNQRVIHFRYTKANDEVTSRSILPEEITFVQFDDINNTFSCTAERPHNKSNLCVTGYCYLRKEKRVFALIRMDYLKIVDSPLKGRSYKNTVNKNAVKTNKISKNKVATTPKLICSNKSIPKWVYAFAAKYSTNNGVPLTSINKIIDQYGDNYNWLNVGIDNREKAQAFRDFIKTYLEI